MNEVEIGERIKKRREELGMSQLELAEAAGYSSRTAISKIENNANGMTQAKLVAVANALCTTPSCLMGWEESEVPAEDTSDIDREFKKLLSEMTEDEKETWYNVIKTTIDRRK